MRLHIGILGQTNAGKSTLLNAITAQNVSIVSPQPGTTTDPVQKTMELKPFGPVLFIDTAGYKDQSILGETRKAKTTQSLQRFNIAIVVIEPTSEIEADQEMAKQLHDKGIPFCLCCTKMNSSSMPIKLKKWIEQESIPYFFHEIKMDRSSLLTTFIQCLERIVPQDWNSNPSMLADFISPGDTVVLVIPIDKEAPKNRIILPQQQAIRSALDQGSISVVTGVSELPNVLSNLKEKPALVVTDSQAFKDVFPIVPIDIPVTGFSILLARLKGDLDSFVQGIQIIPTLVSGDRVLILEACSHNPVCNDIGRDQIPNGLREFTGKELLFDIHSGHDFPEDITKYRLIIHCGGCILNRQEIQHRILTAHNDKIPFTNYGMVLSYLHGDLVRALEIFKLETKKEDLTPDKD
jgi:[FeFe] hydrogenase H-cluster maturation GTPase HydF